MRTNTPSRAQDNRLSAPQRMPVSRSRHVWMAVIVAAALTTAVAMEAPSALSAPKKRTAATVRLALDWTPNTDHTGFFVAQSLGYYAQAGLNVQILPYGQTSPSVLVNSGKAECGIGHEDLMLVGDVASGLKLTSVMAVAEHQTAAYVTLASSKFKTPADLSGSTYGGFGSPGDQEQTDAFVSLNGGASAPKYVNLNTGALAAVIHRKVDFADVFEQWEVIEAKLQNVKLRVFPVIKYGLPDSYGTLLECSTSWLRANPSVAKAFVAASVKGWEYSIKHPAQAAKLVVKANPGVFPNAKLMTLSQEYLVHNHDLVDAKGRYGCQTAKMWTTLPSFYLKHGVFTKAAGKAVTKLPRVSTFFTNAYMPYSCK